MRQPFLEVDMKRYISKHINQNKYISGVTLADRRFESRVGWVDCLINDSMIYSHRRTDYSRADFDETAHIHDFYELVIYVEGDVDIVTDREIYAPARMSAALFPPRTVHNTRLRSKSVYERYVFYFYPDIFNFSGRAQPFGKLFGETEGARVISIPAELSKELTTALGRLDTELSRSPRNDLLAYVYAMGVMGLISEISEGVTTSAEALPPKMLEIKAYIENNYAELSSVTAVSEHFFYSREYVSRMFKRYYNVSVSDYIARLRVVKAIELMKSGASVTETCFAVGFGSASAFYLTFRRIMGMSPSEYVKREQSKGNG